MIGRPTLLIASAIVVSLGAFEDTGPRPMSLVDLAQLPRVIDPQLSPDGRVILYALSHADWKADRPVWQIWRQEVGQGPATALTFAEHGIIPGFTRWSPDGRTIAFDRDGQLWSMAADGGEPRALTRHATPVAFPSWTPDGTALYFLASDARTAEDRERAAAKDDVYSYDETFDQRHLWRVTVADGTEQRITSGPFSVLSYRISRDGKLIAFERAPTPRADDEHLGEAWVMDAAGGDSRPVTRNDVAETDPELSPNNRRVLFLADANAKLEPYYCTRLFVVASSGVPASGGHAEQVAPDFPYAIDRATWTPDGHGIIAVANMGVHSEIFRINVTTGAWKQLTDGHHAVPPAPAPAWSVEPRADRIAFLFDEPTRFGDAWTLPLDGGSPVRVTNVYDALDRTYMLPRQDRFQWKGTDSTDLDGVIFYPADYTPGRRYPIVFQLHGGPAQSDQYGAGAGLLLNYVPALTAKGYIVLRPNYRGSSGYGDAFYRDVVGHYFRNMHLDVVAAADALIAKGLANPDELVVMGWSAGGHLTNKLITFTDRFKAASSGAGASDFTSFYAQSDEQVERTPWFGGTPWQADAPIANYWGNSPLKDVSRVKTPTLFFVGDSDTRVPLPQSIEMWRALRSHDVPTHLYVAPGEGHQWGGLHHQLFKANAELEWFEKYARHRTYTWERAPDR